MLLKILSNNMKKLFLSLVLFFLNSQNVSADTSCDKFIYSIYGFYDIYNIQKNEKIRRSANNILDENTKRVLNKNNFYDKAEIKAGQSYITEYGIEEYVNAALQGKFPLSFYNELTGDVSLLDIALMNKASEVTLNKLKNLGLQVNMLAFNVSYETSYNRISLLENYKDILNFNLSDITFPFKTKKLNIVNFTIAKKDFKTLRYLLHSMDEIDISTFDDGDLISLEQFDLIEYSQLSSIIDAKKYQKKYQKKFAVELNEQKSKLALIEEFEHFKLVEICNRYHSGLSEKNNTLFAISSDIIIDKYDEYVVKKELGFSDIDKELNNPIYSEVFARIKEQHELKKIKLNRVRSISDVSKKSNDIIYLIGKYQFTEDEYDLIHNFDNKKNYKLANIRLDWIANYIIINSALLLTDTNFENKVKQIAKALNSNKRFGKNLAYYLFYRSNNNANLLSWYKKNVGMPVSDFGLNIIERLAISTLIDDENFDKIKFLSEQKQGISLNSALKEQLNYYEKLNKNSKLLN